MSSSTYDSEGYDTLLVTIMHDNISCSKQWVLTIRRSLVPNLSDPKTLWNWEPLYTFLPAHLVKGGRITEVSFVGGLTVIG